MKRASLPILLLMAILTSSSLACKAIMSPPPTPMPTEIPTARPTFTPLPTATHTATLLPTNAPTSTFTAMPTLAEADAQTPPASDVVTETQDNGSVKVTDTKGGYRVVIPAKWFTMNLSEGSLDQILSAAAEQNPELARIIEASKGMLSEGTRILAIENEKSHMRGSSIPTMMVVMNDLMDGMPLDMIAGMMEETLPKSLPGAKILSTKVETNPNGVETAQVELTLPTKDLSGTTQTMYERMVIFQGKGSMVMMALVVVDELRETLKPSYDAIVDSIEAME